MPTHYVPHKTVRIWIRDQLQIGNQYYTVIRFEFLMFDKMFVFLTFFVIVFFGSTSGSTKLQNKMTDKLPKVRRFVVKPFLPNQAVHVYVELESTSPLEIVWNQRVINNGQSYYVPITSDSKNLISTSSNGNFYKSSLDAVACAEQIDDSFFNLRIITRKSIILEFLIPGSGMNVTDLLLPNITSKPQVHTKIRANSRGSLIFEMARKPETHHLLHLQDWRLVTESSVAFKRVKYLRTYTNLQLSVHDNTIRNDSIQTSLTFDPFLQAESGLYETSVTFVFQSNLLFTIGVFTEVAFTATDQILIGVETCSGDISMPMDSTGEVELLVNPGLDCLRCVAAGHPRPYLQISKFISSSNVSAVTTVPYFEAGLSYAAVSHLLNSNVTSEPDSYFCLASQMKPWPQVNIIPLKVTVYTPVKILLTESKQVVLKKGMTVKFTCEASGSPLPEIEFYLAPKWAVTSDILVTDDPEEDLFWRKIKQGSQVRIIRSIDHEKTVATMTMKITAARLSFHRRNSFVFRCLARNKRSSAQGALNVVFKKTS